MSEGGRRIGRTGRRSRGNNTRRVIIVLPYPRVKGLYGHYCIIIDPQLPSFLRYYWSEDLKTHLLKKKNQNRNDNVTVRLFGAGDSNIRPVKLADVLIIRFERVRIFENPTTAEFGNLADGASACSYRAHVEQPTQKPFRENRTAKKPYAV